MKRKIVLVAFAVLILAITPLTTLAIQQKTTANSFQDDMRKIWEDHITWTRLVIVSLANNLPDLTSTVMRLLANQEDIGNAIKPYYGVAAGDQLTVLLKAHINIAAEILVAAKNGDTATLNDAISRWYANADSIAVFLNNANPNNWPLDEMRAMMKSHLDLTLKEAVDYLGGNYVDSVADYDQVHAQILEMADMLSFGIIQQFPNKFSGIDLVKPSK